MCSSGMICVTEVAGRTCQVNLDAGIGPNDPYAWRCIDLPESCDGIPSCGCLRAQGVGICLTISPDSRVVTYGCV